MKQVRPRLIWVGLIALALGILLAPLPADAQPPAKVPRIGVLTPGSLPLGPLEAFRQGLRDLGYVEAQNIAIEWRFAEGKNERLPDLAGELVRLKVDVIFAINTSAAQAAKDATRTIPVVIARVADPVRSGLVASIARPGGNVTGLSAITDELTPKRLQLLKEALPRVSRVAVLWNSGNRGVELVRREMELASPQLGLQLQTVPVQGPSDFQSAFEAAIAWRAGALFVIDDVLITLHKRQILDLAVKSRLPVVSVYREFAEAGSLMAYGLSVPDMYRRAGYFVDKILKGAKPADLPVEQPTKFELVINLKTAKALGLAIPPSILLRADQLIE